MPRQTNRPLTVVALLLAMFLAAMEMTVVFTAMPTAVGDLDCRGGWTGSSRRWRSSPLRDLR